MFHITFFHKIQPKQGSISATSDKAAPTFANQLAIISPASVFFTCTTERRLSTTPSTPTTTNCLPALCPAPQAMRQTITTGRVTQVTNRLLTCVAAIRIWRRRWSIVTPSEMRPWNGCANASIKVCSVTFYFPFSTNSFFLNKPTSVFNSLDIDIKLPEDLHRNCSSFKPYVYVFIRNSKLMVEAGVFLCYFLPFKSSIVLILFLYNNWRILKLTQHKTVHDFE